METAKVDLSDWMELVLLRIGDKVLGVIAGDLKGVVGVLMLDLEFEIMLLKTMTYRVTQKDLNDFVRLF